MDSRTRKHLQSWIEGNVSYGRERVAATMVNEYENDIEFWDRHSWPELFAACAGHEIEVEEMNAAIDQHQVDEMA
jgi:hypothetical protein